MTKTLPAQPDLDWLRKTAKQQLKEMRAGDTEAKLHQAQLAIARDYGFASWRELKAHVDAMSLDGQIITAAVKGNETALAGLLAAHPAKITVTGGQWGTPLLHLAAQGGHLGCVKLLLGLGFDVNQRDKLDHAAALHWAAAEGHLDVVKYLIAVGADIEGAGDDHELNVIGWATCFQHIQRAVADYLLARGAKPTIFSSIARSGRSPAQDCRERPKAPQPADEPLRAPPHAPAFCGTEGEAGHGGPAARAWRRPCRAG